MWGLLTRFGRVRSASSECGFTTMKSDGALKRSSTVAGVVCVLPLAVPEVFLFFPTKEHREVASGMELALTVLRNFANGATLVLSYEQTRSLRWAGDSAYVIGARALRLRRLHAA
jgi:hypothetical protein